MFREAVQDPARRAPGCPGAALGPTCPGGHYRLGLGRLRLVPESPGPGRVLRKQTGLFGAQGSGARKGEAGMVEGDLHSAVGEPAHAGPVAVELQLRQVIFQIAQVAIRA